MARAKWYIVYAPGRQEGRDRTVGSLKRAKKVARELLARHRTVRILGEDDSARTCRLSGGKMSCTAAHHGGGGLVSDNEGNLIPAVAATPPPSFLRSRRGKVL